MIERIIAERRDSRVIVREAPVLGEQGRPAGTRDEKGDNITFIPDRGGDRSGEGQADNVSLIPAYGNRASYLAARLKRDRPDVLDLVDQVTVGNQGGPNNPWGREGKSEQGEINADIISIDSSPAPGPDPHPDGTSATYALRRLRRERPDLHARVLAETRRPAAGYSQRPVQQRSSQ